MIQNVICRPAPQYFKKPLRQPLRSSSQANFTCPIGHFMTEHTGVTEVLHSVLTWENEMTNVATTPWIEPIALETTAYLDGAR